MYKVDKETGKLILSSEKEKKELTAQDGIRAEIKIIFLFGFCLIIFVNLFEKSSILSQLLKLFGAFRFILFLIPIASIIKIFKDTFKIGKSLLADPRVTTKNMSGRTLFNIPIGEDLDDEQRKVFCYDFRESHTLIGGVTRYGKSVLLNTIIYGLMKISPKRARLVIIDFKGVDFALFEQLPHLLTETIITDKIQFKSVLEWLVSETDKRFKMIKNLQVRNIKGYNQNSDKKMEYIFVILDEYLKMLSYFSIEEKREIVNNLNALISTSAGCGIILFLTTQRPDIRILDGTIKANLSNRIAFHCADENNSKIILDEIGAEQLRNKGEMIFKTDVGKKHLQGLIFDDKEIIKQIKDISCKYPQIFKKIFSADKKEKENNLIKFIPKQDSAITEKKEAKLFKNEFIEKAILKSLEDNKINLSRTYIKKILSIGDKKADEVLKELKQIKFISDDEEKKVLISSHELR